MGEIADAILDGDLCQVCGVYMEGGNGYPQTCGGCLHDTKPRRAPAHKPSTFERVGKESCPTCGKRISLWGLDQHNLMKHSVRIPERPGETRCPICTKRVKIVGLQTHIKVMHPEHRSRT